MRRPKKEPTGPTGEVPFKGDLPRNPSPYLRAFRRKTTENSVWLNLRVWLGIEPDTSHLPVLKAEPLGHYIGGMESRRKTYHFGVTCSSRQLRKRMKNQNTFHMTYVASISRLEFMEYIYPKAVMNALDKSEEEYSDVRIFRQYCFHSVFHDH